MYETILNLSTGRDHRVIGGDVQERAMSRSYRITDPFALAERLRGGGFETEIVNRGRKGKFTVGGAPWRAIVVARETAFLDRDYRRTVGFLCSHDGRTAFAARVGVNCSGCLNQFNAAPVRVLHTDPEIDGILADPVGFARRLIGSADRILGRLDSLRSIGSGESMLDVLRVAGKRRLHRAALQAYPRYFREGGNSFWSALQALTDTKSPTLEHLAGLALDEGWEITSSGHVPACWDRVLGPVSAVNQ